MDQVAGDSVKKDANKVQDKALQNFQKDQQDIQDGKLKSPSDDFQFVWNPDTGQRFLFKGIIDPLD